MNQHNYLTKFLNTSAKLFFPYTTSLFYNNKSMRVFDYPISGPPLNTIANAE